MAWEATALGDGSVGVVGVEETVGMTGTVSVELAIGEVAEGGSFLARVAFDGGLAFFMGLILSFEEGVRVVAESGEELSAELPRSLPR
jgi:hypothetical protein